MESFRMLKLWQLRMLRNGLTRDVRHLRRLLVQALAIVGFTALLYWGTYTALASIQEPTAHVPATLLLTLQGYFLTSVCLGMFVVFLMSGLRSAHNIIFQADDLPFLLAQPLPQRSIFMAKFVDSYLASLALALPMILGIWNALGAVHEASWTFYAAAFASGLIGTLLYHSLIVMLLVVIMRFVPGSARKQFFVVLAGLSALMLVLVSQVLASRSMQSVLTDPELLLQTVQTWEFLLRGRYLPHVWLAKAVLLPLPDFSFSFTESLLPLLVSTIIVTGLVIKLAERSVLQGWSEIPSVRAVRTRRAVGASACRWPQGPFWAILRKDILTTVRDPLFWYHLLVGAIIIAFFFYNISGDTGPDGSISVLLMPVLLASISSAQIGGIGLSREGSNWQLLRAQAIAPGILYWSKLVYAALPLIMTTTAAAAALTWLFPLSPFSFPVTCGIMGLMALAVAALHLLVDILLPDFNMRLEFGTGRKDHTGTGKLMATMLFTLLYIVGMGIVLTVIWRFGLPWIHPQTQMHRLLVLSLALTVWTGVTCLVSYRLGTRRLRKLLLPDE